MQAMILAAGMGKRLKELTKNNTKCMVKVNGVTLIERMLGQIEKQNVSRIIIVIGYEGEKLREFIGTLDLHTEVEYVYNPIYDQTNNIYSLYLARDYLVQEDTLLFESDLIVEDGVLEELVNDPRDTLALVSKYEAWMDGTCVVLNEDDSIASFVPGKQFQFQNCENYYKTVNIYKFGKEFSRSYYVPFLTAYQQALGQNQYYEQVLRVITMLEVPAIRAKRMEGKKWYEIDDVQDLDIAESIFAEGSEKTAKLMRRYGGYWRYPGLLDFCYLVNPYFPPKRMIDELQNSFEVLLRNYPSGMGVMCLLAAKNFGVHEDQVIVGNGAAELIRSLMGMTEGKIGVIRPTFEEYPNRLAPERTEVFTPENPDFSYTDEDVLAWLDRHPVSTLVLINPDNPSGSYIPHAGLMNLVKETGKRGIRLIVDESFADFAEEENNSLLDPDLLENCPHLIVVKSISKSYGVPGLRLGILACGDHDLITDLKQDVSIWNINSFGEYYLQIAEKYRNDYRESLVKIKAERRRFMNGLSAVKNLRVIPSEANYIMVECTETMTSRKLQERLLEEYDILIKDLSAKTGGNYIRLAGRNTEDNDRLLAALDELMN